jgi:hypothetical protein
MSEILVQYVVNQRGELPKGWRVLSNGQAQKISANNPLPSPTERLDVPREVLWQDWGLLLEPALAALQAALRTSGILALPAKLLINYCKEDPGAGLWLVNLDGQSARIVVYDPRPKRDAGLDALLKVADSLFGSMVDG